MQLVALTELHCSILKAFDIKQDHQHIMSNQPLRILHTVDFAMLKSIHHTNICCKLLRHNTVKIGRINLGEHIATLHVLVRCGILYPQ